MQLTIFDYLPQNERQSEICMLLFKPKRGPRMRAGYAAEAAKAISDRIQAEPIAVGLEQLAPVCSKQTPTLVHSTPVSSPGVTAPEPAAKVVLGIPLKDSHPGCGDIQPVCFYCKDQDLEYVGLFPNAIKTMNHHIWRCKKQPRHQLVCAEKGDWWYQWCGGVGYGVTYGVPEPWMWKDVFQAATGQEPEAKAEEVLTLEDESSLIKYAPPKSDTAQPCHHCGEEMRLKSWDILTFKLQPILKFECQNDHWLNFYPPPLENEEDKNHVSDNFGCVTVFHTGSGITLKTIWTTSAPWMREVWEKIRAEQKGMPNTQALEAEAAELREKIAEVHEIRLRQKKVLELKRQIGPEFDLVTQHQALLEVQSEIDKLEKKLQRLELRKQKERLDQFTGPYVEKWLKWTRNKLAKLKMKKEEILNDD